jgi:hypothetical protein
MADALAIDWTGKPCPKCGYVRTPLDANPAWQCPHCQIAYAKFAAATAPLREQLAAHGRALAGRAGSDHSLLGLVVANAVALAIAWYTHMTLRELLLVYWIQSVVIGVTSFIRILKLHRFSTEDFKINDRPVDESPATKAQVAGFFALHYGFFHFVYLMFLAFGPRHALGPLGSYALCAIAFAVTHGVSLWHNLEDDATGRPNIGTLMFLPYARIVPMHLMIITGLAFSAGAHTLGFLLFGALKTVADGMMHVVEHHVFQRAEATP